MVAVDCGILSPNLKSDFGEKATLYNASKSQKTVSFCSPLQNRAFKKYGVLNLDLRLNSSSKAVKRNCFRFLKIIILRFRDPMTVTTRYGALKTDKKFTAGLLVNP
jgi:hypothetical protein